MYKPHFVGFLLQINMKAACKEKAGHSGKLKLAFTSPDVTSACRKSFLTSRIIDFTVLLLFEFLKKTSLACRAS